MAANYPRDRIEPRLVSLKLSLCVPIIGLQGMNLFQDGTGF